MIYESLIIKDLRGTYFEVKLINEINEQPADVIVYFISIFHEKKIYIYKNMSFRFTFNSRIHSTSINF